MNNEGAFARLVDLIGSPKSDAEPGLHRLFMELLYEMARIQRVRIDDLSTSKSSISIRHKPDVVPRLQPKLIVVSRSTHR